jgi:hypothetical protein
MQYMKILSGNGEPMDIFQDILPALEDIHVFPDIIEQVYQKAQSLDDANLDRFRFALIRVQIWADIHRNEDMEKAQNMKYVAQVTEKIIFGSLLMSHEEIPEQ